MDHYEPTPERPEKRQTTRKRPDRSSSQGQRRRPASDRPPLTEEELQRRRERRAARQAQQRETQQREARQRQRPPQKKKKRKKKSRKKVAFGRMFDRRFGVRLATALALVAAVILCCIVFFRVSTISVTGNETYTTEQILEASGIEEGDALLLLNKTSVSAKIIAHLPYVDEVQIGTSFPNVVRIQVKELDTAYAVSAEDGTYWLTNSQGRVVEEITGKEAADYLSLEGFQVRATAPGETVEASRETEEPEEEPEEAAEGEEAIPVDNSKPKERMETAFEIIRCLETNNGTAGITRINVENLHDIQIHYGTQYQVDLGSATDLAYKVEYMLAAVEQLNDYESGVLDLTFKEEKVARFIPWTN